MMSSYAESFILYAEALRTQFLLRWRLCRVSFVLHKAARNRVWNNNEPQASTLFFENALYQKPWPPSEDEY